MLLNNLICFCNFKLESLIWLNALDIYRCIIFAEKVWFESGGIGILVYLFRVKSKTSPLEKFFWRATCLQDWQHCSQHAHMYTAGFELERRAVTSTVGGGMHSVLWMHSQMPPASALTWTFARMSKVLVYASVESRSSGCFLQHITTPFRKDINSSSWDSRHLLGFAFDFTFFLCLKLPTSTRI